MQNSKSKCMSTSHQRFMDNAKDRLGNLQERFTDLQAARKEGRARDVSLLEEQVCQTLREWKAELDMPSPSASLIGDSLGSFSDDIARLLQLCEEEDDAISPLKEPVVLNPEPTMRSLSPGSLMSIPDFGYLAPAVLKPDPDINRLCSGSPTAVSQDYLLNNEPQEHWFQGFDECKASMTFLHNSAVLNSNLSSQLDCEQLSLHQKIGVGLPFDANIDVEYGSGPGANNVQDISPPAVNKEWARDAEFNILPNISPPPLAFMGPKCALWDCTRPVQGFELYKDYCCSFHATLALNEEAAGLTPVLRPGGIVLKDNLLFDALRGKTQGRSVGIPYCEGAAITKTPWNASELFDIYLVEGETVREWLFFDKPKRAFESGNRKQRSLPDYNGRGWHESRKQVVKEFGGHKKSYFMDPQPSSLSDWHLYEYVINSCDAFALYRLELKLVNGKKTPKGKAMKDSLADLQKKMGRLTAEVSAENKPSVKGKVKVKTNRKAECENGSSQNDTSAIATLKGSSRPCNHFAHNSTAGPAT